MPGYLNKKKNSPKFHKETFDRTTADRRQRVLDVAVSEFAANGYNATNINEIAKKAGVSIGAMYSYFASKEDLFLTVVNNGFALLESVLKEVMNVKGDLFEIIGRMLVASREYAVNYPELNQIYLDLTTQALSPLSDRLAKQMESISVQFYREAIRNAKGKGIIKNDVDEEVVAFCIDNLLIMYQFSFASDYYKKRMKIFLGEERLDDMKRIDQQILHFIRKSLVD